MAKMKGDGSYHPFFTYFKFLINKLVVAAFKTAEDVIHPYLKTKEILIIEITTTSQKDIRTYEQLDFQFGEDTLEVTHVYFVHQDLEL